MRLTTWILVALAYGGVGHLVNHTAIFGEGEKA